MQHPDRSPAFPGWGWLPQLRPEVWILSAGQLVLFIGQGFTLVYGSLYFVNQLGFSSTQVGLALSSAGLTGMVGRFAAGNAIDSVGLGRRRTLLGAAAIAGLASLCLAFAKTFPLLLLGNLLMGLGLSFYWPATLAVTTDLTDADNRAEAFAITRLADNLGLGLGAVLAGQYVALSGNVELLFIAKGLVYWLFGLLIYFTIPETLQITAPEPEKAEDAINPAAGPASPRPLQGWLTALGDRPFILYLCANLFFTTYAAQLTSTLPLFLANFVPGAISHTAPVSDLATTSENLTKAIPAGLSEQMISQLFLWHALLKIILQLPLTRWLQAISHLQIMRVALGFWGSAFGLIWLTGVVPSQPGWVALVAFAAIAMAEVLYAPAAVALVGDMAPVALRGIYFSLESECWAVGYLLGPALGGWALDQPGWGGRLWLGFLLSGAIALLLLLRLQPDPQQPDPQQPDLEQPDLEQAALKQSAPQPSNLQPSNLQPSNPKPQNPQQPPNPEGFPSP